VQVANALDLAAQLGWVCAPLTIIAIHFYLKHQNKVRAAKLVALGGVQDHAKVQERDGEVVDADHGMLDLVSAASSALSGLGGRGWALITFMRLARPTGRT
jgi:hypothetical protein